MKCQDQTSACAPLSSTAMCHSPWRLTVVAMLLTQVASAAAVAVTQLSNGIVVANLPGVWKEQVDPAGQTLTALGPVGSERLDASAVCQAGFHPPGMSRKDLEHYFIEQLKIPLSQVKWESRKTTVVGWAELVDTKGRAFTRHQLTTQGSCFVAAKYSRTSDIDRRSARRASEVLGSVRMQARGE